MFWKKQFPLVIVFVMGVVMAVQYFIPHSASEFVYDNYLKWGITIGIFGHILGYFSFFRVHVMKVKKKTPNWGYSLLAIFCAIGMIIVAALDGRGTGGYYMNIYLYTSAAINATVFSLLAFYISSAAYRAFRARSVQAVALLLAAIIVMLGRVPIGNYVSVWTAIGLPSTYDISQWILNVPNMAAKRAIALGVGLGSLLMTLKLILGIERTYLGNQ
ncbi:hypothetical protein DRQ33_00975 [bacterium]|mgnify:CR=1 FL=1|nr:MAG: hypothetical protein DRQ33_00975 [bacterium]